MSDFLKNWQYITDVFDSYELLSYSISYSSGQYQLITINQTFFYISNNYGNTWTTINNLGITGTYWTNSCISTSGQYQIVTSNNVGAYLSTNYGISWSQISTVPTQLFNCTMSASGQYQYLLTDYLYISSNYGVTWNQLTNVQTSNYDITTSASGQYITYTYNNGTVTNLVTSNNYGQTWTNHIYSLSAPEYPDGIVSMSSSGQYQSYCTSAVVAANQKSILISSDYGTTWINSTSIAQSWYSIAMTSSGQYQIAFGYNTTLSYNLQYSSDYGNSWTLLTLPFVPVNYKVIIGITSYGTNAYLFSESGLYLSNAGTSNYKYLNGTTSLTLPLSKFYALDNGATGFNVTLPSINNQNGYDTTFRIIGNATNAVTIQRTSPNSIYPLTGITGQTSIVLGNSTSALSLNLVSLNENWYQC